MTRSIVVSNVSEVIVVMRAPSELPPEWRPGAPMYMTGASHLRRNRVTWGARELTR